MEYLLQVADQGSGHMMVLSLDQNAVKRPAIDVVFDLLGTENPEELTAGGILPEGQVDEFKSLQKVIFDRDDQGLFIRDGINMFANGSELNPDAPMVSAFLPAKKDGVDYKRCNLVIGGVDGQKVDASNEQQGSVEELGRLMFLHQIGRGALIDVTRELAELSDIIAWAERETLIEIDVDKAAYKLTEKGKRRHASYMEEAQDLIKRYDIFTDVDIDSSGEVHFDSNLGRDMRVPIYELEGIDPYRARFLLGLNDGEWDKLENWTELSNDEKWYREIFAPIDGATSVEEIGRAKLEHVVEAGKAKMRQEGRGDGRQEFDPEY
ncbi:MAG: hypothetical protein SGJ27_21945 [Candidatus Melainabacteria bacterium]|nr:hypothetical protein [Candidatus Melainabacteria bacterium]